MATSSVLTGGQVVASLPDIRLPRLDGGEFSLRDLHGKRVLLFFWGSW